MFVILFPRGYSSQVRYHSFVRCFFLQLLVVAVLVGDLDLNLCVCKNEFASEHHPAMSYSTDGVGLSRHSLDAGR